MDGVDALAEQHAELEALLAPLTPAQWALATPCEGWCVADVVLHLAQTDDLARDTLAGRWPATWGAGAVDVDAYADASVAAQRSELAPAALLARWRSGAAALRAAFSVCDGRDRVRWVAGTLSARTLATTRLAECWIHTGDVAAALGVELVPAERVRDVARLAWRTLPYAFERAGRRLSGPVAFELTGPDGGAWSFEPPAGTDTPATVIEGPGVELCLVAARRVAPDETALRGSGPDVDAVLELVRTYA